MLSAAQQKGLREAGCEIAFDDLTRALYATDASIYQITPDAVAFPRDAAGLSRLMEAASAASVPVVPRGAGTGLAGGAIGAGLVIDLSRYPRTISKLDVEARTVEVDSGVVLDQLNAFLAPHGLGFGPDVATSSRATFGGMIANNSSGARTPIYGTTTDHVRRVEVVLADGRRATIGMESSIAGMDTTLDALIGPHAARIAERMHPGVTKRWPGYQLDRYLRDGKQAVRLLGGSEGTLALVTRAELNLIALPKRKALGLIFFASVAEAMQATVALLALRPAAIEHIDDVLYDQTRGQLAFAPARALLGLDELPCKSILVVEFMDDAIADGLAQLEAMNLGLRTLRCEDAAAMNHVWNLRKAGLSLLTGCKGAAKPTAFIEDVAIPPEHLPEYVAGLEALMKPLGLPASYYGHAASGLLHVRPVVDLHDAEDLRKFRYIADGVAALAQQYRGSLAGEHGVGIARTEYMPEHLGELLEVMRAIKQLFDPAGLLNPGKIFGDAGNLRVDANLRQGAGTAIPLPFAPVLRYAAKDESFVDHLEQCNGCGGCRKAPPTMCPTYAATGEEIMSTRGRANTIRAVLEGRTNGGADALASPALEAALSNCLACKACGTECPSNVNLALLKAELLHARQRRHGLRPAERLMSRVDLLGKLGSLAPGLANASLRWPWLRGLLRRYAGIATERPLPEYAAQPFDRWFKRHTAAPGAQGTVLLWDDCFARYNEPNIGRAAVHVLEAMGFQVQLVQDRACCGRPAFSLGRLDVAREMGAHNLAQLGTGNTPLIFLEPSCYSMFKEDYRELGLAGAEAAMDRAVLFEHFLERILAERPDALPLRAGTAHTAIHAHCHAKALTDPVPMQRLAQRIPGNEAKLLPTGCCGMAGAFGALADKYALSTEVAKPLVALLARQPDDAAIVASGTSCRHQITHLTGRTPLHMAELLAQALPDPGESV